MMEFLQQLVFVMLVLSICWKTSEAVSNGCSDVCEYYDWGKDARCQGRNLSHVPQECRHAKTLQLQDNSVKLLQEGTFINFTYLKYLNLERNGMELQRGAFKGCSILVQITLNDNHLPTLTPETMAGLTDKLQVMFVDNTGVKEILPQAFEDLTRLQYLSLKNNQLTTPPCYAFSSDNSLSTLHLTSNNISQLPDECFAVFHQLKKLYLKNNPLRQPNGLAFRGLIELKLLDLQYTNLTRVPTGIFPHANKIETLYLSFNNIPFLNSRDFASLPGLRNLYLQHNSLISIHAQSFEFLSSLHILDLSHNMIRSIEEGALNELEYLTDLRLHHNQLNSTKNITFSTISSESKVHLSHNPLHCDCSIYPFKYWLQSSTEILSANNIPSSYLARCSTPQTLQHQLVRNLEPHKICADPQPPDIVTFSAVGIPYSPVAVSGQHNMANAVYAPEDTSSPEPLSNVHLIAIVAGCIVSFILIIGGFILLFMKRRSDNRARQNRYYYEDDEKKHRLPSDSTVKITANPLPELPRRPDFYPSPRGSMETSPDADFVGMKKSTASEQCPGYISQVTPSHRSRAVMRNQSSIDTATSFQTDESHYSEVFQDPEEQDPYQLEDEVSPAEFVRTVFEQSPPSIQPGPEANPKTNLSPIQTTETGYVQWRGT